MSKPFDPEDPLEIDKWTRAHYKITDESTEDFLSRNGFYADTPRGLAKRLDGSCVGTTDGNGADRATSQRD
jgi:hypothetical protein